MPPLLRLVRVGTYLLIVLICLINFTLHETDAFKTTTKAAIKAPVANMEVITIACKLGLDFADINEFKVFIEEFKLATEEQLQQERVASKCIKQREAILELEKLIVTDHVCDTSQIDNLISYHTRYLKSSRLNVFAGKPITQKFFSKYAILVAYTCKRNLIKNLEESRELLRGQEQSLEQAKEKIYRDSPELKSNINLIMEQPDAPSNTNAKETSETEQTLGEYREALTRLKRPEDILTFERSECEKSSSRRAEIVASEMQMFFKPTLVCLNLAQYYSGSVLSIARLANYGYTAYDAELDVKLADSALVKDWIVAVQICEPMLYMRTEKIDQEVAVIDTCSERVTTPENMLVFDDKLEDFDNERLEEWLRRSEASRPNNQKIMRSTMKKLAKANLLRQIKRSNMKVWTILKIGFKEMMSSSTYKVDMLSTTRQVSQQLSKGSINTEGLWENKKSGEQAAQEALDTLMAAVEDDDETKRSNRADDDDELDGAVGFSIEASLLTSLTLWAITMTFEWIFFVVMTLAARICHRMNFDFDSMLVFPPKVLSWKDAEFTRYAKSLEGIDEDDFFDYEELTPDEQKQRDLLAKVFGRPPPMLFRE